MGKQIAPSCEDCVYFDVVEDDGAEGCTLSLDQDEAYECQNDRSSVCRYFRFYDEYKSVQKQN